MKTFALLWLNGTGGNTEIACCRSLTFEDAVEAFRLRAPELNDYGYIRFSSGGAWCVVEEFSAL